MADNRYTTTKVAEQAGISRDTLLRWLILNGVIYYEQIGVYYYEALAMQR